jgi:hypothetical protein
MTSKYYRAVAIVHQRWRWLWSYYPTALVSPWDEEP